MPIHRSVPGVFGNQQANYLDLIKQMLQQAVVDMTNYEVIHILYGILFLIIVQREIDTQDSMI